MEMNCRELIANDWKRLLEISGQTERPYTWKNAFSPRFSAVYIMRRATSSYAVGKFKRAKFWSLINFLLFNAEIPASAKIGPGFVMPHPQGIVLGAGVIGKNVTVMQQVTFGAKTLDFRFDPSKRPSVEDNVMVSAGAKIIGSVTLGEGCVVGANAVVIENVTKGTLAVGVPARIIAKEVVSETNSSDLLP